MLNIYGNNINNVDQQLSAAWFYLTTLAKYQTENPVLTLIFDV